MFQPPAFREDRPTVIAELVRAHPLGMLTINGGDVPIVHHLPMVLANDGENAHLLMHLSRGNDLIKRAEDGQKALAVFQGSAHYISPSWYPGKKEHGKVVPTYNYMVAHLEGTLHFHEDVSWLLRQLHGLTDQMEQGREMPWQVNDAPEDFTARQLKGIYGAELRVTHMAGKWKVSQNRAVEDQLGVVQGLHGEGNDDARHMAELIASKL